jgi:hypothetical protein
MNSLKFLIKKLTTNQDKLPVRKTKEKSFIPGLRAGLIHQFNN